MQQRVYFPQQHQQQGNYFAQLPQQQHFQVLGSAGGDQHSQPQQQAPQQIQPQQVTSSGPSAGANNGGPAMFGIPTMYMNPPPHPISIVQTPTGPAIVQQDPATGLWMLQQAPPGATMMMQPQAAMMQQSIPQQLSHSPPSGVLHVGADVAHPPVPISPSAGLRNVSFQSTRGHGRSLSDTSNGGGGSGMPAHYSSLGNPQMYNRNSKHHRRQSSTNSEQSFVELQQHFGATNIGSVGGSVSTHGPMSSSATPNRSGAESGSSRPGSVENARPHHGHNVHGALQGKCTFFAFPPNFMSLTEVVVPKQYSPSLTDPPVVGMPTVSVSAVGAAPTVRQSGVIAIPLFCQMFPIEYVPFAGRVLQFVCDSVCGAGTVASIRDISAKSEKSFTANFLTDNVWEVVSRLRRRVLMDRHGFWFADDISQYIMMKQYCEGVRKLPQHTRHFLTDGLPCMPLVIEICRGVNLALLPPQMPHQQCFDEIALPATTHEDTS